jgi:hypothetical protein
MPGMATQGLPLADAKISACQRQKQAPGIRPGPVFLFLYVNFYLFYMNFFFFMFL